MQALKSDDPRVQLHTGGFTVAVLATPSSIATAFKALVVVQLPSSYDASDIPLLYAALKVRLASLLATWPQFNGRLAMPLWS